MGDGTSRRRWHLAASLLLAALTVVAVRSTGPAPMRALVFLDVIFVVFASAAGIALPYLVHVTANAVIGSLAVVLLR